MLRNLFNCLSHYHRRFSHVSLIKCLHIIRSYWVFAEFFDILQGVEYISLCVRSLYILWNVFCELSCKFASAPLICSYLPCVFFYLGEQFSKFLWTFQGTAFYAKLSSADAIVALEK